MSIGIVIKKYPSIRIFPNNFEWSPEKIPDPTLLQVEKIRNCKKFRYVPRNLHTGIRSGR